MAGGIRANADGVRAHITVNGTDVVTIGAGGITSGLADGSVTPAKTQVGALPSMIRVVTSPGYASTNTNVLRFTTIDTNQGTDITYASSATLGDSFTINTNGTYAVSANIAVTGNSAVAITKNAISGFTVPNALTQGVTGGSTWNLPLAWIGYLPAGTVLRLLGDAVNPMSGTAQSFTVVRVA